MGGDVADTSDRNKFNRITVDLTDRTGAGDIAIRFNFGDAHKNGGWSSSTDQNEFYNCTFYNAPYLFENSRPSSNNIFVNCLFDSFTNEKIAQAGSNGHTLGVNFTNCNFSNIGYSTSKTEKNSSANPQFANPSNGNFTIQNSALINKGVATPFMAAGNDLGSFQN